MSAPRPPRGRRLAARLAGGIVRRDLRRTLRRALWIGPEPWAAGLLPRGRPLVLYANHHYFHDSYLLWHLTAQALGRPLIVWMRDWSRAPLFAPLGAAPFPADDPRTRLATMRATARRMREDPSHVFLYYPEGGMGPPDGGVQPFERDRFSRLARLLPEGTLWWPVAVRITWWGEDRPTALLTGGAPHEAPDGEESARLEALLDRLREVRPGEGGGQRSAVLLEGRASPHERWDLSPLAPLFSRWV